MNLDESAPYRRRPRHVSPRPITTTIDDTCHITGLGKTKIYELIAEGRLKTVSVGRRRLVMFESIEALLLPAADIRTGQAAGGRGMSEVAA